MQRVLRELAKKSLHFPEGTTSLGPDESALVWQYVRFNPKYREHYDALKTKKDNIAKMVGSAPGAEDDDSPLTMDLAYEIFSMRWCISNAVDYEETNLPDGTRFKWSVAREIPVPWLQGNYMPAFVTSLVNEFGSPFGATEYPTRPVVLLVDPLAERSIVLAEFEKILDRSITDKSADPTATPSGRHLWDGMRRESNLDAHLLEYLICYYYRTHKGLRPTEVARIYREIMGIANQLQPQQIIAKAKAFESLSALAPHIFMLPRAHKRSLESR